MSTNNSVNTSLLNQTGTGAFVGSISPTITTPVIAQINDVNGNAILAFSPIASAVNYLRAVNQITGQGPILQAIGADTDIPIALQSKGISAVFLQAAATGTNPTIAINSGTSFQHATNFIFSDTANTRRVTFQDADGTVAFTSDISSLAVLLAPTAAQTILTFPLNVPGGIYTPEIFDVNGNVILSLPATASAVNYIIVNNNATGQSVALRASGSDTNIEFQIIAKGTDAVSFYSEGIANPIIFNTGTTNQHITNFAFANTANTRTITFQDASGTLAFAGANSDITSLIGLTGVIQGPTQINDVNGNAILQFNANAGSVNNLAINNSLTGNPVEIGALGTDTNISIEYKPQAAGTNIFISTSNSPITFLSGTLYQKQSNFIFANTAGTNNITFPDASGVVQLSGATSLITAPAASQSSALVIGTAFQNTLGYDVVLTVYLAVASATTANILLGVGPTATPTQQTIVNGLSLLALGIIPVTIYLPSGYFALLSTTGTISVSISGQQIMPV